MTTTSKPYSLSLLAICAADDLTQIYSDRTAPTPAAKELANRLKNAASSTGLMLPSERTEVLDTLRRSTRGGMTASTEAIVGFAQHISERLLLAVHAAPPRDEYQALCGICMRMAETAPNAAKPAVAPAARATP